MSELAPTLPVVGDGGGYRGRGLAPVPVSLTIDGVRYALCVDPSMAGLKAIREYAGHERPQRVRSSNRTAVLVRGTLGVARCRT